jgi:signal transduction histidine kinase
MSSADLAKARSFGIRGLHERASTVGGWIDLSSGGRGTSLILSVPIADWDPTQADLGRDFGRGSDPDPDESWTTY